MAAHRHADGPPAAEALRACARDVVDVAEGIREVSARTSSVLFAPALTAAARRHPRTGCAARWALLRALTDKQGLGGSAVVAPDGMGRLLGAAGQLLGRQSLAALVAVTSLRLRLAALLLDHPEFAHDPGVRRLTDAVDADDEAAVRALRALFEDPDAQRALCGLAPVLTGLLIVRGLLAEDPGDDEAAWALAAGHGLTAGPGDGIGPFRSRAADRTEGAPQAVEPTAREARGLAAEGSLLGFLRNIDALSAGGRLLVQEVRGPDGVLRYVVQAPGTAPGRPRDDCAQDFAGAWRNLFMADSPYTRAVLLAVRDHGIPRGADLALIGHGEGGIALLNLARDDEFCRAYRVTHVVAVGAPLGGGSPADPRTWVAGVTNRHDIVPVLDGRGTGTAGTPHPNRYEVDYTGPTREFPLCHLLSGYLEHLETVVPQARVDIDRALTPYRGRVERSRVYRLGDRGRPPEGHPFLTVPTTGLVTSAGPVDVPVRYYDSSAVHLCYPVDPDVARTLLPDVAWLVPTRFGRRALAVLSLYEHRCTTLGPYTELALSVPVDDPWRPHAHDIAADLLRPADLRRTGRYVVSLAVGSREARAVAEEVWAQPAVQASADVRVEGRELRVRAPELGLSVEGRPGPGVRCPEADWVLYGRRGESTVRTLVRARGQPHAHARPRVRLRLDGAHGPLARQLQILELDAVRPGFALTSPRFMAHRSAGAVLPR
ncbi:acetoacetate decarboxylase family protein [Streptomyces arenae]|uniref:acetoacetate decarboxylase family protein n=1 Tax=Streptomyces arenae TaxID=29301 RepID=UPI00265A7E97|nr:acetoacetate decarboxylase family protein [Streptomyces arenae]MCG7208144.1 acetoacetate decarboxylase family protein [Streptomyces arenae]